MNGSRTILSRMVSSAVFAGALLAGAGLVPGWNVGAGVALAQDNGQDAQLQAKVNHELDNKRLRGITGKVQGGTATLSGTVTGFADKLEAQKKVGKVKGLTRIDNRIQVNGPEVSDQEIAQKLARKLAINQLTPDRTAFEFIDPRVQQGTVTLLGLVVVPVDKEQAENYVAEQPGVKNLVDKIIVAPPSPNDDRIRHDLYEAIYGYSSFTKYAVNPAKSIRILVLNGNVTLVGGVDSQGDKELAGIRANGVPGVFKVTNDLQVVGQNEK